VKSGAKAKDCFDKFSVILRPLATEKAMKKMEEENTMVFKIVIFYRYSFAMISHQKIRSKKHLKDFIALKSEASTL